MSLSFFFPLCVVHPAPFRGYDALPSLRPIMSQLPSLRPVMSQLPSLRPIMLQLPSLRPIMSQLPSLRIDLSVYVFSYSKLQKDILHLVKCVPIVFHIGDCFRCVASVLRHHIEIDQRPDASESTLERYQLGTRRLTQCHSQNA